jgi:hypothetical protein
MLMSKISITQEQQAGDDVAAVTSTCVRKAHPGICLTQISNACHRGDTEDENLRRAARASGNESSHGRYDAC